MNVSAQVRLTEIRQRRELLLERAATQRGELAAVATQFRKPLHWIHRIELMTERLRERPLTTAVAMFATALVMGKARRWVEKAIFLYQFVHFVRQRLSAAEEDGSAASVS